MTIQSTVAIIKPDGLILQVDEKPFTLIFEEHIIQNSLRIIDCFNIRVDEEGLRKLFPAINHIGQYGDMRNIEFIKQMQNKLLKSYIIEGNESIERLHQIKKDLRSRYMCETTLYSKMITNLLHSTDLEDLEVTLEMIEKYRTQVTDNQRNLYIEGLTT